MKLFILIFVKFVDNFFKSKIEIAILCTFLYKNGHN